MTAMAGRTAHGSPQFGGHVALCEAEVRGRIVGQNGIGINLGLTQKVGRNGIGIHLGLTQKVGQTGIGINLGLTQKVGQNKRRATCGAMGRSLQVVASLPSLATRLHAGPGQKGAATYRQLWAHVIWHAVAESLWSRAKFVPISPQFSHSNLGMTVIHPWGALYGLLFVCSQFRHHDMIPAHGIVHYMRPMGDPVSFVPGVPGLEEGVMFGGKALGYVAGT